METFQGYQVEEARKGTRQTIDLEDDQEENVACNDENTLLVPACFAAFCDRLAADFEAVDRSNWHVHSHQLAAALQATGIEPSQWFVFARAYVVCFETLEHHLINLVGVRLLMLVQSFSESNLCAM
jgi:hypothetical protein